MRDLLKGLLAIVVIMFPLAAAAQDDLEARTEAARAYVATEAVQDMMDDMFSEDAVQAMLAALVPAGAATEAQREEAAAVINEELTRFRPEVVNVMVEATAATFTLGEIEALTAFYGSPEGRSILKKMQPYMQQAFRQMGPALQSMQQTINRRVREEVLQ